MALTATIRKAELQISDMDRGYYATHNPEPWPSIRPKPTSA